MSMVGRRFPTIARHLGVLREAWRQQNRADAAKKLAQKLADEMKKAGVAKGLCMPRYEVSDKDPLGISGTLAMTFPAVCVGEDLVSPTPTATWRITLAKQCAHAETAPGAPSRVQYPSPIPA